MENLHFRNRSELFELLVRKLELLVERSLQFDEGDRNRAFEISAILRVLVKHKGASKSLLKQLAMRDEIIWACTEKDCDYKNMVSPGLIVLVARMTAGIGLDFIPKFSEFIVNGNFNEWHNQIVLYSKDQYAYSREQIIDTVSERYEVHVDPSVDKTFHDLINSVNSLINWKYTRNGLLRTNITSPILSVLRQIAHEVLVTLEPHLKNNIDLQKIYFSKLKEVANAKLTEDLKFIGKKTWTFNAFEKVDDVYKIIVIQPGNFQIVQRNNANEFQQYMENEIDEFISRKVEGSLRKDQLINGLNDFRIEESIFIQNNNYGMKIGAEVKIIKRLDFKIDFKIEYVKY